MKSKHIVFCWFSGTGNTRLVVHEMTRVFESAGIVVSEHRITRGNVPDLPAEASVGLGFPVAYQSTYPFVWDFVYRLPPGEGREIFMVDTLGGFSGGLVGPMGKLLRRKGYLTVGAREIRMPMNFGRSNRSRRKDPGVTRKGISAAAAFSSDLIEGRTSWGRIPLLSDLMFLVHSSVIALLFTGWNQKTFGIRTDETACTGCSACAEACPVGNISMKGEGDDVLLPVFGRRCEFCLSCVSVCPVEANRFIPDRHGRYRAGVPTEPSAGMT